MELPPWLAALGGMVGGGGIATAVWKFIEGRVKASDAREQMARDMLKAATDAERSGYQARIVVLENELRRKEAEHRECEESLKREIRQAARNYLIQPPDRLPETIPDPPYAEDENTGIHNVRRRETRKVIEEERKKRADSDPPTRESMDILIIDDEEAQARAIHQLVRRMSLPSNFKVEHTTDALQGRALLTLDPRVKVAIVDYLMPRIDGQAVIEEAMKHRPDLRGRIIIISGADSHYPPDIEKRLFEELGCLRLGKPFEMEQLEALIWSALQA